MLLQEENRCCLMVAELQREIVGMCSAQLLVSTAVGGLKAVIEDMVIAENYRGQRIGHRLLAAVEGWAINQGVKRMDLLADRRNTPALSFYEKANWRGTELICLQKKL
jgi:GNAT superfamily N-acetyltransferase